MPLSFLNCFCDKFLTMDPAITLQTAFILLCWHKSKLLAIPPLPGLKSGWAASGANQFEFTPMAADPVYPLISIWLSVLAVGGHQPAETMTILGPLGFATSH